MLANETAIKARSSRRIVLGSIALLVAAVVSHMIYDRIRGHVMASLSTSIAGRTYSVQVRERCTGSLDEFIFLYYILRSRNPDFEYWAELSDGGRRVAQSPPYRQDSYSADSVRILSADGRGASVVLDREPPTEFPWSQPPPLQ